jgi:hypothetical protein
VKLVMERVGVKLDALVPVPWLSDTEILPGTAPLGTTAFSDVPETIVTVGDARAPNLTTAPGLKPCPLTVTVLAVIPDDGVNEPTVGAP